MKVAVVFLAVFAVSSAVVRSSEKEKRGAIAYTTPRNYQIEGSQEPAYVSAKLSPKTFPQGKEVAYSHQPQYQTVKYALPQQAAPAAYQQQYDYEQAYQGQQQTVTKLAPAKVAYSSAPAPAQAPAQTHYSLASDVSSFSYNSPVVKYSNLGVLSQTIGKLASPQAQQQVEYAQQAAPQVQYTPQKVAYALPQQQQQQQQQKLVPQQQYTFSLAAPQQPKLAYTSVPQRTVEYTKPVQYVQPQQQQVGYAKPQAYQYAAEGQQQQQEQQYVYQQVPQGYTAAQSNPQGAYSAPQGRYYSAGKPAGVRYA